MNISEGDQHHGDKDMEQQISVTGEQALNYIGSRIENFQQQPSSEKQIALGAYQFILHHLENRPALGESDDSWCKELDRQIAIAAKLGVPRIALELVQYNVLGDVIYADYWKAVVESGALAGLTIKDALALSVLAGQTELTIGPPVK